MTHLHPSRSNAPHRKSLLLPFPELVSELTGVIGRKLTAYITGSTQDARAIDHWIAGVQPYGESEQRLRFAYHVVMTLCMQDKPQVVQAWLIGVNPDLGDQTAIRMLREDPLDVAGPLVLEAARAFASGA